MAKDNVINTHGGKKHQIQRMLPRHFKILDLRVAGLSNKDIATALGISSQTVSTVIRSPLFANEYQRRLRDRNDDAVKDEVDQFAKKARSTLERSAQLAANTQVDLLESEDDSVKLRTSQSILDRVLGKVEGSAASGPQLNLTINTKDAKLIVTAFNESKELSNGQDNRTAADGRSASPSDARSGEAHQTPLLSTG